MNVNKKLGRFKQWAGEKMGSEAKTGTTDDFKALETEMNLRHDGMDRLHKSMSLYVKAQGRKESADDRDKMLPVGYLGSTMVGHGQDFSPDSEFGNCLLTFGRANEAISRRTEGYVTSSTSVWLESLERSLAQMKEYQAARKKLETRRLAYDASLAKMQKAKKEDFRVEEELRAQKAKYEESNEDVFRRMEDIKEAEVESIADLTKFLEEELAYHESCREILSDLHRNWPGVSATQNGMNGRKPAPRGRSNTMNSFHDKYAVVEEEPEEAPAPKIKPVISRTHTESFAARHNHNFDSPKISRTNSLQRTNTDTSVVGGTYSRFASNESPAEYQRSARDYSPDSNGKSSDPGSNGNIFQRTPLRSLTRVESNPDRSELENRFSYMNRNPSPPTYGNRNPSPPSSASSLNGGAVKKAPPPPPPSRAKKPMMGPQGMKRSAYSTDTVPHLLHQ
ncbi:BAR-domain-containing protein [Microthyrium microscopicum]|uniref:BAR-domain-containing protein n=1 Tax=Microthyrium microscopicum TaxID=703497 RepID=A0A6A6UCX0_9PEZI|nr:BAR-domain-containing protein [Microthyrium microscopicum]